MKPKPPKPPERFAASRVVGNMLSTIGAVALIGGVVSFVVAISQGPAFAFLGIWLEVSALFILALGEILDLLRSIEKNTRLIVEAQSQRERAAP